MVGRDVPTTGGDGPTVPSPATRNPHHASLCNAPLYNAFLLSLSRRFSFIKIGPLRSPRNAGMVERLGNYYEK